MKERKLRAKKLQSCSRNLRHNATLQERILWGRLRDKRMGLKFRRQAVIDDKYVVDFVCLEANLIVEVDGSQHAENKEDEERTAYLQQRGFRVIRFWNNEINKNLQHCLEVIYHYCNIPPHPGSAHPLPQGRGASKALPPGGGRCPAGQMRGKN